MSEIPIESLVASDFEVRRMAGEIEEVWSIARYRGDNEANDRWQETFRRYNDLYDGDQIKINIIISLATSYLEEINPASIEWSDNGQTS